MQDKFSFDGVIYIGRFQPFHLGHLQTIKKSFDIAENIILVLGSYKSAPSVRNPWNAEQRIDMIKSSLSPKQLKRVRFLTIRDRIYNEELWKNNVLTEIEILLTNAKIAIIGHEKDETSYYLRLFPQWTFIEMDNFLNYNSTDFRKQYFTINTNHSTYKLCPLPVINWLKNYRKTKDFHAMRQQYQDIDTIKNNLQIHYTHTACNTLIYCNGYILLIQQEKNPGKNLWALPGGLLKENDNKDFQACALRGLYEKIKINFPKDKLITCLVSSGFFDYKNRNPLGCTNAHTFFYKIDHNPCPAISKNGDIKIAQWFLIEELFTMEDMFFSDHFQIIQSFLINGRKSTFIL